MYPDLIREVDIRQIGAPVAAGASIDANSDRIDMANYEGAIFIAAIDDSVATGVATLKIEQNTTDSDSGMAALAGATAAKTCAVNDDLNNKSLVVSVHRPRERYLQAVRTSGTANIAFGALTVILYGRRVVPPPQHASVLTLAAVTSPPEV